MQHAGGVAYDELERVDSIGGLRREVAVTEEQTDGLKASDVADEANMDHPSMNICIDLLAPTTTDYNEVKETG